MKLQVAKDMDRWFRASDSADLNIARAANAIATSVPSGNVQTQYVRHTTHLLLYCRDLADRVTIQLQDTVDRRQSELAHLWDMRHVTLSDIADEILKTPSELGGPRCVPTFNNQTQMKKLLPHPIGTALRVRLRSMLAEFIVGMQRPLAYRPGASRELYRSALADLRTLHVKCEAAGPTAADPLRLEHTWEHLPCVLWAAAYIELVDRVEPLVAETGTNRRPRPDDSLTKPSDTRAGKRVK